MDGWRKRLQQILDETPGLNMKALSKRAGMHEGYISQVLRKGVVPTIDAFVAIAEAARQARRWGHAGRRRAAGAGCERRQAGSA
jgi:transcriptional regulator with XRE-family HTH domain